MPKRAEKAVTGGKPKVKGINNATPITAVSPGSAPKTMPKATPIKFAISASRVVAELNALINISNMADYPLLWKRHFEKVYKNEVKEYGCDTCNQKNFEQISIAGDKLGYDEKEKG